jgi:hypothetical protein
MKVYAIESWPAHGLLHDIGRELNSSEPVGKLPERFAECTRATEGEGLLLA